MLRRIIFLFISILYTYSVFPQQRNSSPSASNPPPPKIIAPPVNYRNQDFTSQLSMIDPTTGKSFKNSYPDIKGFPFFTEDWKYSLIRLTDGRTVDMIRINLNLYTKELYFKTDKDVEMVFAAGYVKEINIYDSSFPS